ncbi:hypothetical protein [Bartonella koehlerae]|uniref:TolA protein n=1 Tax=Bartonella koehlerae C-29 TaxID=1134510 RepID=A0A067WI03_9HYPH|nr:hypothetical protein [Bartonella koehlerae]KEC56438.1 hypothetical protein O9A_00092 [Bartonella koehlerae C-29]
MNKDSHHSTKRGLALSLAVHVIFLSLGGTYFTNFVSLPQQLEAIPITLVSVTEEFASQQGALNAPVHAIPAVKPTTKPQEKEDARYFGEGQIDSLAPFKPKEKPRPVETTPSPSGEAKVSEKSLSVIKEQELRETKAEKVSEGPLEIAQKVAPESLEDVRPEVSEKVAPETVQQMHKNPNEILPQDLAPTEQKVPLEQETRYQQIPKIALPEQFPFPQFKPKPIKESAVQNAQATKKQNQQMKEKIIEDILTKEENNLLNRARSQGGGAKRSSEPEALGARKNINDTTKMAQTLVSIAGGCIQKKLKLVALGGDLKNRPVIRLRFYLNREGMVMGDPIIDPLSGEQSQQTIMIRQVYAAVFSCQPYTDLPRDQYDLWGQGFDFNVDPLQEIIR